jgi:hypothetical protein
MKFTRTQDLYGVDERFIETTYWQTGEKQSGKLAIVLPGYIYPPDAPATFFLKLAFSSSRRCFALVTTGFASLILKTR